MIIFCFRKTFPFKKAEGKAFETKEDLFKELETKYNLTNLLVLSILALKKKSLENIYYKEQEEEKVRKDSKDKGKDDDL